MDSLIVVLNEKLLEVLGDDVTQDEAFAHANDVLKNAVGGIAEIINAAYAHNQTLLVKEDQSVRKGQKIAEMGNSDADPKF